MPLGEFGLIERYFAPLADTSNESVTTGIGDDCAVLSLSSGCELAVSIDTLVAGRHFPLDAKAFDIATRAVAVCISDLAAVGAKPLWLTLALSLPAIDEPWLREFSQGLAQASHHYGITLVGGDTTRGPLTITLQVHGEVPRGQALLRSGAKVGDRVYVSGPLGAGAAALAYLQQRLHPTQADADWLYRHFYQPTAHINLGQSLCTSATSAIDVSDGLLADLGHIAKQSQVGFSLDLNTLPPLPLPSVASLEDSLSWALAGGDDYQLAFTMAEHHVPPPGCTCIGKVIKGTGIECVLNGQPYPIAGAYGYQHFA